LAFPTPSMTLPRGGPSRCSRALRIQPASRERRSPARPDRLAFASPTGTLGRAGPCGPPLLGFSWTPLRRHYARGQLPVRPEGLAFGAVATSHLACSVLAVSHRLDGFLHTNTRGFVSPRCRPWGSPRFGGVAGRKQPNVVRPRDAHPSKAFPRRQPYRVTTATTLLALPGRCGRRTDRSEHPLDRTPLPAEAGGLAAVSGCRADLQGLAPSSNPLRPLPCSTRTLDPPLGFSFQVSSIRDLRWTGVLRWSGSAAPKGRIAYLLPFARPEG
jgi:hypothetical protein